MGTTLIGEPGKPRAPGTTLVGSRGGTRLASPVDGGHDTAAPREGETRSGPVVGWLVVIGGAGRGKSIELGYGLNIVGRGSDNRINLDFGDDQISQDDHFRIAYDGNNRQFHLVPGRGTNLVYVAGTPLLAPVLLAAGSDLTVGSTVLRFVPLCGPDWDWPASDVA